MLAGPWCGACDKYTRLLADKKRCSNCHPLAGTEPGEYRARWCGECDPEQRLIFLHNGQPLRCRVCHPLARDVPVFPADMVPVGWTEELLACDWLCHKSTMLNKIGSQKLYEIVGPYFRAGWNLRDLQHALVNRPTGGPFFDAAPTGADKSRIARWLQTRLRAWRDNNGLIYEPPHWRLIDERTEKLVQQRESRIAWQHQTARRADPRLSAGALAARRIATAASEAAREMKTVAASLETDAWQEHFAAERHRAGSLAKLNEYMARRGIRDQQWTEPEQFWPSW
jgi:hypothetical protein